jgi:hypothetical protein
MLQRKSSTLLVFFFCKGLPLLSVIEVISDRQMFAIIGVPDLLGTAVDNVLCYNDLLLLNL